MKKMFLSLATIAFVAAGSLTVTSCGSDDSSPVIPTPDALKLTLTSDPSEIYAGEAFEFSITEADGTPITGAILIANGEATTIESQDGAFSIQAPEGEWEISASYDGKTSNIVNVTVKPSRAVSEGTGLITYNGGTMDIDAAHVVFRGLFYADEQRTSVIASWQIEAISGGTTGIIRFTTPTEPAGGDQYTYEIATSSNTTATSACVIIGQDIAGQTNENVSVKFGATYENNFFTGEYSGSATLDSGLFSVEFDGKTPRVNSSGKGAKKVATFEDYIKTTTVKTSDIQVLETSL